MLNGKTIIFKRSCCCVVFISFIYQRKEEKSKDTWAGEWMGGEKEAGGRWLTGGRGWMDKESRVLLGLKRTTPLALSAPYHSLIINTEPIRVSALWVPACGLTDRSSIVYPIHPSGIRTLINSVGAAECRALCAALTREVVLRMRHHTHINA